MTSLKKQRLIEEVTELILQLPEEQQKRVVNALKDGPEAVFKELER